MQDTAQRKREEILEEIRQIERLRQGSISEQYYGTGDARQGPYYVLQGYVDGKHWSKRIGRDQLEQVRADLEAGVHFNALCRQYAQVTEAATLQADDPAGKKKNVRRSRPVSVKPNHS